MKNRNLSLLILAFYFFISGCEEPTQTFVANSRLVKTIVVGGDVNADTRTFPAVVDAIQKAEISFRVSGEIQNILVKEGDEVKKGQVLAELDPTDLMITLKDHQANYNTAKDNFDRAVMLVKNDAISQAEHDNIRARYHTAEANLNTTKQNLLYTKLTANFDGYVAKRHAENFEDVVRSQKIFSLEDVSALKIEIDVPETLMIVINKSSKGTRNMYVVFDNIPNHKFPVSFLETSIKADLKTKTFKITLRMEAPADYNVLPGMTATVFAELLPDESETSIVVSLPVSAVVADNKKQATVWIVDETNMWVNPKRVKPGLMSGSIMQVEGLNPGERVVVAGAHFLRKNMKVTLLETSEKPQ
ncbi:MAG: efflux RND transporter periplasmic adaptor subunit [Gammaproteobacteria bacterium]|nr:MAG: efflux RND transporter periplasmic adaptor subunit [Gammaproteobacteria bacterium]